MRRSVSIALSCCAVFVCGIQPVAAQTTKTLNFYHGTVKGDSVQINGLLRLDYAGEKVTSAALDVCFPPKRIGASDERLILPLQVAANGQMTYDKADGSVRSIKLRFRGSGNDIRLNGSISRDDSIILVKEENLSLADERLPESAAEADEGNLGRSKTSSNIMFDIKPDAVGAAIKVLKEYPVTVVGQSLVPTCQEQRDDKVLGSINLSPKRVGEMLKVVRKIPGVSHVRTGGGTFSRSESILIPKSEASGESAEDAILDRMGKLIEKETGGKLVSTDEDEETGSNTITIELPTQTIGGIAMKRQVTVDALVEPAADVKGAYVLFWQLSNYKLSIDGANEKFKIDDISVGGEGGVDEGTPWKTAVAAEFHGRFWDDDKQAWRPRGP